MWMNVIGTFWWAMMRELIHIIWLAMVHNIGEFQNSTFDIFIPLMQRVV